MEKWNGFDLKREYFNGRELIIVFPEKGTENGRWALKTEYFNAFPAVEIELVKKGYHLVHLKNITRWCKQEDTDARAKLAEYMHESYNLSEKCVVVGMSCGGMQGIYFASEYPRYVSCMYLDAPVVNLLSCPAGLGKADNSLFDEFYEHMNISVSDLLSYRNHPLDHIPNLVKNNIPVILVCGDSDSIVPYEENGKLINDKYTENGCIIKTIIKKGCDHHPHGLDDNTPVIDFIENYDID